MAPRSTTTSTRRRGDAQASSRVPVGATQISGDYKNEEILALIFLKERAHKTWKEIEEEMYRRFTPRWRLSNALQAQYSRTMKPGTRGSHPETRFVTASQIEAQRPIFERLWSGAAVTTTAATRGPTLPSNGQSAAGRSKATRPASTRSAATRGAAAAPAATGPAAAQPTGSTVTRSSSNQQPSSAGRRPNAAQASNSTAARATRSGAAGSSAPGASNSAAAQTSRSGAAGSNAPQASNPTAAQASNPGAAGSNASRATRRTGASNLVRGTGPPVLINLSQAGANRQGRPSTHQSAGVAAVNSLAAVTPGGSQSAAVSQPAGPGVNRSSTLAGSGERRAIGNGAPTAPPVGHDRPWRAGSAPASSHHTMVDQIFGHYIPEASWGGLQTAADKQQDGMEESARATPQQPSSPEDPSARRRSRRQQGGPAQISGADLNLDQIMRMPEPEKPKALMEHILAKPGDSAFDPHGAVVGYHRRGLTGVTVAGSDLVQKTRFGQMSDDIYREELRLRGLHDVPVGARVGQRAKFVRENGSNSGQLAVSAVRDTLTGEQQQLSEDVLARNTSGAASRKRRRGEMADAEEEGAEERPLPHSAIYLDSWQWEIVSPAILPLDDPLLPARYRNLSPDEVILFNPSGNVYQIRPRRIGDVVPEPPRLNSISVPPGGAQVEGPGAERVERPAKRPRTVASGGSSSLEGQARSQGVTDGSLRSEQDPARRQRDDRVRSIFRQVAADMMEEDD